MDRFLNFVQSQKRRNWIIIIIIGLSIKLLLLPFYPKPGDYTGYLDWMLFIKEHGYFSSLRYGFYVYTPPYIYILIAIAKTGLNPLTIKIVSFLFEFMAAYFIGKIICIKYPDKSFLWASLFIVPLIPTVFINSAYWGQCDSIYTAFLVASIYFLLKEKKLAAVLFLGIAFSVKMQTVFLLPFYFVMMLRKKIAWYYFLVVPLVYFISILPAWIAGRPLIELLTIYLMQADNYRELTMNFPNLYIWINNDYYEVVKNIGILFTVILTLMTGIILSSKQIRFTFESWIRLAFLCAIFIPFILPGMHERYMYIGDILAVAYFFVIRKNFLVPLGIIFVSLYSYGRCTRLIDYLPMEPIFFIYLLLIIVVMWDFIKSLRQAEN